MYKVHVRAKNPKRVVEHDNEVDIEVDLLTAEAEFRTEPGGKQLIRHFTNDKETGLS